MWDSWYTWYCTVHLQPGPQLQYITTGEITQLIFFFGVWWREADDASLLLPRITFRFPVPPGHMSECLWTGH